MAKMIGLFDFYLQRVKEMGCGTVGVEDKWLANKLVLRLRADGINCDISFQGDHWAIHFDKNKNNEGSK